MDAIDIIETDATATSEETDISFGKEIAKNLTISAAQTAGAIGGLLVVALVYSKIKEFRKSRHAIVIDEAEPVTETPITETEN